MKTIKFNNDLWINNFSVYENAVRYIASKVVDNNSYIIHFLYFASFVLQDRLKYLNVALKHSDYILLDGIGMLIYTSAIYGEHNLLNLNGTDLLPYILKELDRKSERTKIALYGARNDVIEDAYEILSQQYSTLNFYHFQNGYEPLIFEKLEKGSTLLVGLGTPKQECFVFENLDVFRDMKITVITIGGLFDFISGRVKRAPKWLRFMRLEWAHRMLRNPRKNIMKNFRNMLLFNYIIRDFFRQRR